MRKWNCCLVMAVSAMVLSASWAWAQRPAGRGGFGGGGLFLLGQQSVQKELKLSDEQVNRVEDHLAKQRESLSGLRDLDREERQKRFEESSKADQAALASILDENQLKRFKQISLQQRGGQALADPEVATALALTGEQKSKVGEIQSAARQEMRSLFQGAADGDRDETRKKFQEARDATNEKLLGVLTSGQKTQWKEMTGEPFKGEIRRGFRGRNRGAAGAGNRRRRNRDNADSTSAAVPAAQPAETEELFQLASFRDDGKHDDGDDDSDDGKSDAKRKKNSDDRKSKAHKGSAHKAKKPSAAARRRGQRGPRRFAQPDVSRRSGSDRDRAWDRVARTMRQRARHMRRPFGPGRRPGRGFAVAPHHGHSPSMAFGRHGRQEMFGGPAARRPAAFAGFHGHRGHGPRALGFAPARGQGAHARFADHRPHAARMWQAPRRMGPMRHHGHMMARHRGHDRGGVYTMARPDGFRGHDGRERHMDAPRHPHGPPAFFAGHRRHVPMHMSGLRRHKPHGQTDLGKHRGHRRRDSSSRNRRDDDRDGKDRDSDRDRKDRDRNDRDDD